MTVDKLLKAALDAAAEIRRRKRRVNRKKWTPVEFVENHYRLKELRDRLEEEVKLLKDEIAEIEEDALKSYDKQNLEGAKGRTALGFIEEREFYNVADRRELDKFVKRTGHYELYQNRIRPEAVREIFDDADDPGEIDRAKLKKAGIGTFTSINFRTRKRRSTK